MSSPPSPMLQQLDGLNQSSPSFPHQLEETLNSQEYRRCMLDLQEGDLAWLVNYLDKVLDNLNPSDSIFLRCRSELGAICGSKTVLPMSHTSLSYDLDVGPDPFMSGSHGDIHQASLNASMVRVKRVRVPRPKYTHKAKKIFCEEAVKWKRLKHPNIVHVLGFTIAPLQVVSNWMPNGDLPDYIKKNRCADIVKLLSDVAKGICYLHSNDVIHRELKGSNILVDPAGSARVADFGISAIITGENSTMVPSQPEYNQRWSAPEVLIEKAYSKAADIFSFSMLMIEVFSGRIPFSELPGPNAAIAMTQGIRPSIPMHSAMNRRFWGLMQRCWDRDPHLRPEAAEVERVLQVSTYRRRCLSTSTNQL